MRKTISLSVMVACAALMISATTTMSITIQNAEAQGNQWCRTSGDDIHVYFYQICYDNRGECNKEQVIDPYASSACYKKR